jgi:hypothetical protein
MAWLNSEKNRETVHDPILSRRNPLLEALWFAILARDAVDDFVAAKASDFNKSHQLSTSQPQQIQYQSVKNRKYQQTSIEAGIWFGTRCS